MGKLLRVNMSRLDVQLGALPEKFEGLGGRALTSQLVFDEVPPTCEPLGVYNKLVMAPGILGGTGLSSSGRLSVGGKSPLTGGMKESNAGGTTATKLARLGIGALVVEGVVEDNRLYVLLINKDGGELVPADELKGLGNYPLAKELRRRYGERVGVISIGPAGEWGLAAAGVANTDRDGAPARFSGRGGLGAVMGSKGLKAVVIDDSGAQKVSVKDPATFAALCRELHNDLVANSTIQGYGKYGTAGILDLVNELGALPTNNFREGRFARAGKINGEALYQTITQRGGAGKPTHACMAGCLIKCSNVYPDTNGHAVVAPLEYETIGLLGSNCGIDDLDVIARLNYLCNDLGVDTIETGAAIGVTMESGLIPFGDVGGAEKLIQEIGQGTVLGRLLGNGAVITGRVLGAKRIPTVKRQAMPAYDPRAIKGNGVTFATSPMGADHTAGNCVRGKNQHSPEGQVTLSFNSQVLMAAYDSLGLCIFLGAAFNPKLDHVRRLVMAKVGLELPPDYLTQLGKRVLQAEWAFNQQAGLTSAQDRLPEFMLEEGLPPFDLIFDVSSAEMDAMLESIQRDGQ
ncbi:aldehyde:ferredoxin oxidoreductase [Clostridiales bacterium PH28_bin88]|nr:aldehyde:ferredoxin oxidoreductase [Clostridiales bacterium PH28_bin88]